MLHDLFRLIENYINNINHPENHVIKYRSPEELSELFGFRIDDEGVTDARFTELMELYLNNSVRSGSRQFLNQLFSGFNAPAFAGDVISTLTNTSMYTYEVAPVATMMETEIIKLMNSYVGYTNGDGIFVTGGSNGNLIAMFSARNKKFAQSKFRGLENGSKLRAYVSVHAHYSIDNAANILGFGAHNVVKIPVDQNGRMIPDALDAAITESIEQGNIPFFVGATCGTTVMAAFDPLVPIYEICKKYDMWFHADGAFGASLILSPENKNLFEGSEHTDSFCWDAHKLMGVPLISSAFLVRKKGTLQNNLSDIDTSYIYHNNSEIEDLGRKSVQCGRRVDAVKLWFAWKYYGREGYRKKIDHLMKLAEHAEKRVQEHPRLEMVAPRQTLTVCFRYIAENSTDLNTFNFNVRENLRKSGKSLVNVAWVNKTLVVRLITPNFESTTEDVDILFNNFLSFAEAYDSELKRNDMLTVKE